MISPRLPVILLVLITGLSCAADTAGRRIIALSPHAAELVYAAGAGVQLVATVAHSDYPPAARELPRIGDATRLDRERILGLRPDLVIAWPLGNRPRDLEWLEAAGIEVYRSDPQTLGEIAGDLEAIGRLAGTTSRADRAAADLRARLAELETRFHREYPLSVFYQLWPQPLMSVDRRHLISRVLDLCGGRNIFERLGAGSAQISREAVFAANPRALVASVENGEPEDPLAHWQDWPSLDAVREGNLIRLPADLMHRPGPRLVDGAGMLCRKLAEIPAAAPARARSAAEE